MPSKSKRAQCANPIFYKALVELRDQEDHESNMYWTYNRAAKSMKEYPEALTTPDEAIGVRFVGPKLVTALKKKLGEHSSAPSSALNEHTSVQVTKKAPGHPRKFHSAVDIQTPATTRVATASTSRSMQSQGSMGQSSNTGEGDFLFCYLNQRETRVRHLREAHIEIELASGPGYFVEYPRSCQHPVVDEISSKIPQLNRMLGYLPMHIAEDHYAESTLPIDWLTRPAAPQAKSAPTTVKRSRSDIIAAENAQAQKKQRGGGLDPSRQKLTAGDWTISASGPAIGSIRRSRTMPQMPPPPSSPVRVSQQSIASSSQVPIRRTDSAPATTQSSFRNRRQPAHPRLSHGIPPPPAELDIDIEDPYASTDHVTFSDFSPFCIAQHEYDIVLLLDTREIKSGVDRSGIYDGLVRQGVNVEQRALNIGDVCWIAKRKPMYRDGSEYDEIVLDCILERKRLDDLVNSIKDGRFHEQKFRLHNTAITRVYYVVEEYKLMGISEEQDKSTFDKAIETAISQTGIIDRFLVKETKSINDTINFYVRLHRELVLNYQHRDLYVIPSQLVKRYSYLKFQKELRHKYPQQPHLLTYQTFNLLNLKSGFVTVRETWARMLLCIHGVSPEKAGILIQYFPTPVSMYRACLEAVQRQREDDEDAEVETRRTGKPRKKKDIFIAEEFLKGLGGRSERNIGQALSRRIFNVMMQVGRYTSDNP
ncbi:hypothetical protein GYMLUDRAFT_162883 [Collybiopsis luxurians FD-317 M1]|uniref:Crossover junction endonuclease MUS81 n=1 Tax=Collybiopsis luxurians FD-317 M1 TaxID=944289 RepID=A0A0D0BHU7_9AGAR|nr:hypothetical protein GYMLUDRAFT_162883 [Collybiopsis luxurians FD-317 M1]